jgi:A/G-specific adenine glycosylase
MSFALGQHVGVVDTNIKRVLSRVFGEVKDYFVLADECLPVGQADPWNQALMDLGAMVCTARAPKCPECPVQQYCLAYVTGSINNLPAKKVSEKPTVRFADSDRFFRGRIMDLLRQKPYELQELSEKMEIDYGLIDQERFQKLINGLVSEELISQTKEQITLG